MRFIVYNSFGEILRSGSAPLSMIPKQKGPGEFVTTGKGNDETHYVNTTFRTLAPKTAMGASINKTAMKGDGVESAIISGLPVPSKIRINKKIYDNVNPVFEFTVNLPGKYEIVCSSLKFLDQQFLVNAT